MGHYAIVQVINQFLVKVVGTAEFLQVRSAQEWAKRRHVDGQRLQLIAASHPIRVPVGKPIRRPLDWTDITQ
ncbi:MAG: hypothetical protein KDD73_04730 [Anaerolineales bacterium]|nr:hypothetical protein [Anaerolineales bacterium]MCB9128341.1 hypothetical protein [Ardenticatenales bacterium]MCB9172153.1 hypothetical protein [Ardenticatenales bacterium]